MQNLRLELSCDDCGTIIIPNFRNADEICEFCVNSFSDCVTLCGYIYNSDNEVVCNFHGLLDRVLEQIKDQNLDFY